VALSDLDALTNTDLPLPEITQYVSQQGIKVKVVPLEKSRHSTASAGNTAATKKIAATKLYSATTASPDLHRAASSPSVANHTDEVRGRSRYEHCRDRKRERVLADERTTNVHRYGCQRAI
jgi:hypothetical protein